MQKANLMKDEQRMFLGTFLKNKSQKFWGGFLMTEARLFISRNIFTVRKKGAKNVPSFFISIILREVEVVCHFFVNIDVNLDFRVCNV